MGLVARGWYRCIVIAGMFLLSLGRVSEIGQMDEIGASLARLAGGVKTDLGPLGAEVAPSMLGKPGLALWAWPCMEERL